MASVQIILLSRYGGGHPIRLPNPAMVTQEVIDRLTRPFRRLLAPSKCSLDLPVEIILMIASHLDECALASLALTCKSLFRLWELKPLKSEQKEKLLLLLEEDLPLLYYCHFCTKLHRWHGLWSRSIMPLYAERLPCKRSQDKQLFLAPSCFIPYYVARLVMNRHFCASKHGSKNGSRHGLPVHVLNKRARSSTYLNGVVCSESRHVRIFNDQLLVLAVVSLSHVRGDELRDHFDYFGPTICEHLTLGKKWTNSSSAQLTEVAKKGNANEFLACGPAFGSCAFCLTDYRISIIWQGAKGFKIEVYIYHSLGDCRTPFDWHWRTISTSPYLSKELASRIEYSSDYRPGSVRDQWNKAEGIADH